MIRSYIKPLGVFAVAVSLSLPVNAEKTEPVFGQQLMSTEELQEHRQTLRSMESEKKRQEYRREHHQRMLERAREQGVELPDEPGERGKGEGPRSIQGERKGPEPGHGGGQRY